ncbi:MAG: hypothetical protein K0Q72_3011 [Armatimonadetes bacterium]|jgi:uncharacterized protein YndB with AHSA1/START domain|nr:hypothetical protein [Armatimonadota bacterium]
MPVKKEPSGRRSVQAEVEVPGSPEQVWAAIASGPGISSWFVPTQLEGREGGAKTACFGPGMDSSETITAWEPPHRYVTDSHDMGPDDPAVGTEWIVEAKSGDTCVVRVVHSWFAGTDDWDSQFEGHEHGWNAVFRILRLYVTHFSGQPCSAFQLMGVGPGTRGEAWEALVGALGLSNPAVGEQVSTSGDAPRLSGLVEWAGLPAESEFPGELLLRLNHPAPGLAHLFALPMGGQIYLPMRVFLFGAGAAAVAEEPRWQAWMQEHFPIPEAAAETAPGEEGVG